MGRIARIFGRNALLYVCLTRLFPSWFLLVKSEEGWRFAHEIVAANNEREA